MNKKLIKTITCVTCGLGIASSIPATITSCSSQETKSNPIPVSLMTIEEGKITGFTGDISQYDELQIPTSVTTLTDDLAQILYDNPNIHILSFANEYSKSISGLNRNFFNQTHIDYLDLENYSGAIQSGDFRYTTYLKTVSFKNSNCTLESTSFLESSIENIVLDNYQHDLPKLCFQESCLKYVDLSKFDNNIGDGSFKECYSLSGINLNNFKKDIGDYAFCGCPLQYDKLELTKNNSSYIPIVTNKIKMLLKKTRVPAGCVVAGDLVYNDLKSFNIDWKYSNGNFDSCGGVLSINLEGYDITNGGKFQIYPGTFISCIYANSITLPKIPENSKLFLDTDAFHDNRKIQNFILSTPKNTRIETSTMAFKSWTKLKYLELSGEVCLGLNTFKGCESLSRLNLSHYTGQLAREVFADCPLLHYIYVPATKPELFDQWLDKALEGLPTDGGVIIAPVQHWERDGDILEFFKSKGLPSTWHLEVVPKI